MGNQGNQLVSTPPTAEGDIIFAQLWAANQAAFDGGDYETACHALQAALSRAFYVHDAAHVTAVKQEAAEQRYHLGLLASQDTLEAPPKVERLHPARRKAVLLVYDTTVREAAALADLLRHRS